MPAKIQGKEHNPTSSPREGFSSKQQREDMHKVWRESNHHPRILSLVKSFQNEGAGSHLQTVRRKVAVHLLQLTPVFFRQKVSYPQGRHERQEGVTDDTQRCLSIGQGWHTQRGFKYTQQRVMREGGHTANIETSAPSGNRQAP